MARGSDGRCCSRPTQEDRTSRVCTCARVQHNRPVPSAKYAVSCLICMRGSHCSRVRQAAYLHWDERSPESYTGDTALLWPRTTTFINLRPLRHSASVSGELQRNWDLCSIKGTAAQTVLGVGAARRGREVESCSSPRSR